MKVLFLINNILEKNNGVTNKIMAQFLALSRFSDVQICHLDFAENMYSRVFYSEENTPYKEKWVRGKKRKFKNSFLFDYTDVLNLCIATGFDVIYVRYTHFSNPAFIAFLSQLKENRIKVILEIPNYPYDSEYSKLNLFSKTKLLIDRVYRNRLVKFVDRVATMSDDPLIFGIPATKINNGVSQKYLLDSDVNTKSLAKIRFVAAANIASWHGYDRFIISLSEMPKRYFDLVEFHLIGVGDELENLKKLARRLNLTSIIYFHGEQDINFLCKTYCSSHIGVDSLGRHRSNNSLNDSIKSKEYLSCGLPVIMSHVDNLISDKNFVYKVPSNDSPFDIGDIVEWYLKMDFNISRATLKKFAAERCSWESILYSLIRDIQ